VKNNLIRKNIARIFFAITMVFIISSCDSNETSGSESTTAQDTNNVTVLVKSYDGALLTGVTVSVDETSGVTDSEGKAQLNIETSEDQQQIIVNASEDGFITQSVVIAKLDETTVQILMRTVEETISITNIEDEQIITGEKLGSQISLPTNALINTDGDVAEGNVTLQLTPWDVQNTDITAMLGNGQAINDNNENVELISAGMISIDFSDSDGNHLQLASGTTADIQMDLTQTSINNQTLSAGDTIPLWHFDETKGLWIEEGEGTVIESDTSSTGLAISATVEHFSTWNWDYELSNDDSINVSCLLTDGTATACNVIANVTLADGSTFTKSSSIPSQGTDIIYLPSNATINWTATTTAGLTGSQISDTDNDVIITLDAPNTTNFVTCTESGFPVACFITLDNPVGDDFTYRIPESGATISTDIADVSSLTWSGTTGEIAENGLFVKYSGDATSTTSGSVTIDLDTKVEYNNAAKTIKIRCLNPSAAQITTCNIFAYVANMDESIVFLPTDEYLDTSGAFEEDTVVTLTYTDQPIDEFVTYDIPEGHSIDDYLIIVAYSYEPDSFTVVDGVNTLTAGYGNTATYSYGEITDNQLIEIDLLYYDGNSDEDD